MQRKRSFSPSIDDIRQFNVKKQHILKDLSELSLDNDSNNEVKDIEMPSEHDINNNIERIDDIDDYLLHNQSDEDILNQSRHIIDPNDLDKIIIPAKLLSKLPIKLSKEDEKFSIDRLMSQRRFQQKYNAAGGKGDNKNIVITNEDIMNDMLRLKYQSLLKEYDPSGMLYKKWCDWYYNEHKLREMEDQFNNRIEVLPDDYSGKIDLSNEVMSDDEMELD